MSASSETNWTKETPGHCEPSSHGRCGSTDDGAGAHAPAGLPYPGADEGSVAEAWELLLGELRSHPDPCVEDRCPATVVGAEPSDGVLLAQGDGACHAKACFRHLWVVNTMDWIDVEYVLRRMLKCESSECHAFHSVPYAFFRSCATMHVAGGSGPDFFLRGGECHRFPGTEVVVEILRAHPEGVLEVGCYLEYVPELFECNNKTL